MEHATQTKTEYVFRNTNARRDSYYLDLSQPNSMWDWCRAPLARATRFRSIEAALSKLTEHAKNTRGYGGIGIEKVTTRTTTTPSKTVWVLQDSITKQYLGGPASGSCSMGRCANPRAEFESETVALRELQEHAIKRGCPFCDVFPVEITIPGETTTEEIVEVVG